MATYGDEPVDSYFYPAYNPYTGRHPRPKNAGWKYKSYLSHYGDTSDAFNNHQRAQLKSILSQINPKLTPRLRKANTKDMAVQVNPRRDAAVQCSIGLRTLAAMKQNFRSKAGQEPSTYGRPKAVCGVRYPRTLAVYSPIAFRSVTSFLVDENNNNKEESGGEAQSGEPPGDPPENAAKSGGKKDKDNQAGEDRKTAKLSDQRKKMKSKQTVKSEDAQSDTEGSKVRARVRFQFLEQKYGYYHCRECNLRWESAYVWCVQGTNKVYFKQYCRKCQKDFNPYRVEDITCQTCNKARCSCAITRHIDPKRPHRQDLCGRCKGKRLSCDSTFSFKYII